MATTRAKQRGGEARRGGRDSVVLEHLPLVRAIAVRAHQSLPVHVDVRDLLQAGILGLLDAVAKYRPQNNVAFSGYAKHRIKGAILDSLRQLDWASRNMRRRLKQVEAVTRELAATLRRAPTEAEIAQRMGIDFARWRDMLIDLQHVGPVSASARRHEHDELPVPEFPAPADTRPDRMCSQSQLRALLEAAMKTLPPRYQKIVALYYLRDLTMREIGTILGVSEHRVSQIHKSALQKMGVALRVLGIQSSQAF